MSAPSPRRMDRIRVSPYTPECSRLVTDHYGWGVHGDEFDDRSEFIVASSGPEAVGIVRLTGGAAGPLQKWCENNCPLPAGKEVVQMTRGVVHADFRGQRIYKCMMVCAIEYAHKSGFSTATAAVEPTFPNRAFLEELGFETLPGMSIYLYAPGKGPEALVNLVCNLSVAVHKLSSIKERLQFKSDIFQYSSPAS